MVTALDRILVTGASSGIGRAIAIQLAKEGYEVVVHFGHNLRGAQETVEAVEDAHGHGRLLQFDTANTEEAQNEIELDIASNGAYYGVICNAGITRDGAFPTLSVDDWKRVVDVNLNGFYNVLKPAVMPMIRRRKPGRIIALSSIAGVVGNRGQVNYSASKAGIIGATKALGIELAKRQITVNCVAPGLIDTEMTRHLITEEVLKAIPMRRVGTAEEVASLVTFLCSPQAAYITRQVFCIDGGLS